MNRSTKPCVALLISAIVIGAGSSATGTSRNNGNPGYQDQALFNAVLALPVVPQGLPLIAPRVEYHSTIVAQSDAGKSQWILDRSMYRLINDNFMTFVAGGYIENYQTLNIHMAQCFSGGFIDELDHGVGARPGLKNFSINTSSVWHKPAAGTIDFDPPSIKERSYYSKAWINRVDSGVAANRQMLNAYTNALTAADFPADARNAQMPQYFSRPNGQDTDTLGSALQKKVALLFVGSNIQDSDGTRRRHYRDALRMYNVLRNRYGYAAADIKVYYDDGTAPDAHVAGLPIDDAATIANFESFFTAPPQTIAGEDDSIFIWTSDHGGQKLEINGQVQMAPRLAAGDGKEAEYQFDVAQSFLDAVSGPFASERLGLPFFEIDDLINPSLEAISVFLNDMALGTITSATDQLPFSPSLLLSSSNSLRFETFTSNPSSITLGNFGLHVFTSELEIPEPTTVVIVFAGVLLRLLIPCRQRP